MVEDLPPPTRGRRGISSLYGCLLLGSQNKLLKITLNPILKNGNMCIQPFGKKISTSIL